MSRIRILFFLNSRVRGGVEEVVLALVNRLDRTRFEVHLAAPPALLDALGPDLERGSLRILPLDLTSPKQLPAMLKLVRYLRHERIQIVNSHLFRATLFSAPLARLAGVPVVIETTHGPESWRRSWWKRSFIVDRVIERFVTANIAVSEANREYLVRQKRYPARKITVIPNGRDLAQYAPVPHRELCRLRERYGLSREDRVIAAVARLEPQKGHRYLLAALPAILRRFPDVKLLLIGDGSLRPELERMAADLTIRENVIFAGFVSPAAPYYFLAEFIVLPSLYEGMPLAAIEAGAAGKAIVATAVDGTREVVEDGRTGLLVPGARPELLAAGICRLLEEPELAHSIGRAARAKVAQEFAVERQIELTSGAYRHSVHG